MNEQELDQLLQGMAQDEPDPAALAAARERVWNRLSASPLCLQFREQFDEYRAGRLDEAPRLLLEDHLTRCAGCRRAFNADADEKVIPLPAKPKTRRFAVPRWAIAAGVAAVGLFLGRNSLDRLLAPAGPRATVETATGSLYALNAAPLVRGATLADGETIRTAAGARARIRLADGSEVEVNERTELAVQAAWSGATILLERGDIIVHAAKQRRGYLKVVTRDSEAAVKGTIFTVSAGTAGSLVGVVEGSVAVTQPGTERLLKPGEQQATTQALGKVTVREAVAWSADREKYFTLMNELAAIEKQLVPPAQRTSARLISALPPQVAVYVGLPNLGPTMQQAVSLIEQRSRENTTLHDWWNSPGSADLKTLIEKMQQVTPLLGEEIAFALVKPHMPLVMAEVKPGKEAELQAELKAVLPKEAALRFHNGLVLISNSSAALDTLIPGMGRGAETPFGKELAARYARGVKWILGADIETMDVPANAKRVMGQTPPRFAFLEQRTVQGAEENEATVTFAGPRKGVAAWLAEPGSAGSAEYASADAVAVVSAATRNPRQIMEELETMVPSFSGKLDEIERQAGVNVRNDVASALGTDFTVSIETAAVPIPGWFAAVEVYQPTTLNAAITRFVEAYNRDAGSERKLAMTQETVEGRQWNALTMSGVGLHWTFDRGYWIVAMDRAVAMRAIATRAGGFPLVRSSSFKAEMPTLAGLHPSGFVWFHTGPAAGALAQFATAPELKRVLASGEPSLTTINGETERIQIASRRRLTSFIMDTMLRAGGKNSDERRH